MFDFLLPPAPSNWNTDKDVCKVYASLSKSTDKNVGTCTLEPIGEWCRWVRRKKNNRTLQEDEELYAALLEAESKSSRRKIIKNEQGQEVEVDDDDEDGFGYEDDESPLLLQSDPLEWKNQDHYAILGLGKKRWEATEDDIRRAYRKKVLKHHPDKKTSASGGAGNDSFFKCIQKAWEVMSDVEKRKQWDSVDPAYDDDNLPTLKSKADFFDVYKSYFHQTARFSILKPVPKLGNEKSSKEEVDEFYKFWYNFESWRTFEALDEESAENAESREEKRWLERKNKSARAKRKREENARILRLVDEAYKADPRIAKFKEEEKAAKEAKKREKEMAAQALIDEAKRKAEAEEREKERIAKEEKEKRDQEKKEKELAKRAIKKERKAIKNILKDTLDKDIQVAIKLDEIFEQLEIEGLEKFRIELETAQTNDSNLTDVVQEKYHETKGIVSEKKKQEEEGRKRKEQDIQDRLDKENREKAGKVKAPWTPKEVAILIKAVKMFPGGALNRWEKIAEYVNGHGGVDDETDEAREARQRTPDECIRTVKDVQRGAGPTDRSKLQDTVSIKKAAPEITERPTARNEQVDDEKISVTPTESANSSARSSVTSEPKPKAPAPSWSANEQSALELALRKFPASMFAANPAERWDKIAAEIGKTKKDVKLRMKELQELVKKKKATA